MKLLCGFKPPGHRLVQGKALILFSSSGASGPQDGKLPFLTLELCRSPAAQCHRWQHSRLLMDRCQSLMRWAVGQKPWFFSKWQCLTLALPVHLVDVCQGWSCVFLYLLMLYGWMWPSMAVAHVLWRFRLFLGKVVVMERKAPLKESVWASECLSG